MEGSSREPSAPPFPATPSFTQPRILLAEDDEATRVLVARALRSAGYEVLPAENGREAIEQMERVPVDAVVTDISMPEMTGIQLLRAIRGRDAEVPVVLMTGSPDVESAMQAVKLGALSYLTKPVDLEELKRAMARAVRLGRIGRLKQEALALVGGGGLGGGDLLALDVSFERTLEKLWVAYQPIVRASDGTLFGYEALLRSDEPTLPNPGRVIDAAERLDRVGELGRIVRALAVSPMDGAPQDALLFVNLHSRDLLDATLFSADAPLARIAGRVVLEITERSALDEIRDARDRIKKLRTLGYRIAIDDLGAGYAGLTSFITLEPDFVKLEMSLIRDIDREPTKRSLVRSVTALSKELGMQVVAEGIETRAERDAVIEAGCDLLQGYLLAKPGRAFPQYVW
ncbi:MAG TPA: EAL domain-containing protein [Polyangiaceae bacterium]|nr:EAL domain-containing protein [Polyangiaceae bacterium]